MLGFAIIFLVRFTQSIINKLNESKEIQKFNKSLRAKGYAISDEPEWHLFIVSLTKSAKKFGDLYGLRVKVAGAWPTEYIGILERYDYNPPYGVALTPKYIVTCTVNQVLGVLTNDDSSPLKKKLIEDDIFLGKVVKYLDQGYMPRDYAYSQLKSSINSVIDLQSLEKILEGIDFSVLAEEVVVQLRKNGAGTIKQEYENFTFIKGESIRKVEVLGFETLYMLNITYGINMITVPKPHLYQE